MSTAMQTDAEGILRLRPTVVRASAGTGKTYQLTARLLRILLQGSAPETILATTFTRKAAGEILSRVLLTLANASDPDDQQALEDLRQQIGIPTIPRARCQSLLRELIAEIHRVRISTLDSVFSTLARSMPFELGLPSNWRLTDEIEEQWLRRQAIDRVVDTADAPELRSLLAMLGGGRVVRSVTREMEQVIDAAYAKQRRCPEDAWDGVKSPRSPSPAQVSELAAILRATVVPQKRLQTKLASLANTIDSGAIDELAEDTLIGNIRKAQQSRTPLKYYNSAFPDDLDNVFDLLYETVRCNVLTVLIGQNRATGTLLRSYEDQISSIKESRRVFGFDDIALRLANHFDSIDPDSDLGELQRRLDGVIEHLLLDEFQDTSPVQWSVLRPWAVRTAERPDSHDDDLNTVSRSFFCVGDTKQAIYGFRGGVAEIFDTVTDQLDGVETVAQDCSYRSSPVVLDFVTRVFQSIRRHPHAQHDGPATETSAFQADAITRFSREFPVHEAAKSELPGCVRMVTSMGPDQLGDRPTKDQRKGACLDRAADEVESLHREAPEKTIGILTRSRRTAGEMMWRLQSRGLTVSQEGGNPLTDSVAVEIVLSALMMIEHPGDRRWRFHVDHSPLGDRLFRHRGDSLRESASQLTRSSIDQPSNRRPERGHKVEVDDETFRRVTCALRQLYVDRGLVETVELLANQLAGCCGATDTVRLRQLVQLAIAYQPIASTRLRDFVETVREKGVEQPQAAKVRVMTIHASKGLEFDAVVLPELDEPLTRSSMECVTDTPSPEQPPVALTRYVNKKKRHFLSERWQRAFGLADAADMTEALCLMYVAMTRAKHDLRLVIQPTSKPNSASKTPASLIIHSLQLGEAATEGQAVVFESGDAK